MLAVLHHRSKVHSNYSGVEHFCLRDLRLSAVKDTRLTKEEFNLTELYLPLFRLSGTSPICDIEVERNQLNTTQFVIKISEGSFGLEKERYLDESSPNHEKTVRG
ncbi:hypothetical protein D915_009826 [Fasciola hepatica]|uniref:Uncharacterized protein n=1 Tax=Fasciola hepatica TaxID=6192 RepID=A0A4E0RW32_FASHE|nr:hypothetical protein D915_009826 [Fasciola hepatica]